ncbi:MAG TPA: CHASE2 domain-containing protein [Pyrinomonadaceae bacterium]|nr:CHASE2 domain-containing protein [Pyrinomonadaceae bacterium]
MATEVQKPSQSNQIRPKFLKTIRFWFRNYWVRVVIIAILGIVLGEKVDDTELWINYRYHAYQLLQRLSPRKPHPQRTVLVLIGDNEYWSGKDLQARVPIKRDYLARLVDAAAAANAAAIALDFDLRSPSPEGNPLEFPEYQKETDALLLAVQKAAASGKKIVLTKTVGAAGQDALATESDIYGREDPGWENVTTGYHILPDDTRNLPLSLELNTGRSIDSFCLAIARAENAPTLSDISNFSAKFYSGFVRPEEFPRLTADELLRQGPKTKMLANRVVMISGDWHSLGPNRGAIINSYDTPIGVLPGVMIHANYFESLWDSRFYRVWEGWSTRILEFFLALLVAAPFAIKIRPRAKKLAWIVAPYLLIFAVSYVSLINFGWFFDPVIPVLSVTAHGVLETVLHWRKRSKLQTPA